MPLDRSQQMSRIRGTHTSPERILRSGLWRAGFRYRLHARTPAGRPDIVFPGRRVAVFIDGCFWHGCPRHYVSPRTNRGFWEAKLRTNVDRDRRQTLRLEDLGWRVFRFWECDVLESLEGTVAQIGKARHSRRTCARSAWRVVSVEPLTTGDRERRVLEDLRDARRHRIEERRRTTYKARAPRPRGGRR